MNDVRRRVVVSGRVQGVFFRDSCARVATASGVNGSVRNRDDGSVEVIAEGAPDAVDRLVEWCRHGPRRAHVTGIEISDEPPTGAAGFEIAG